MRHLYKMSLFAAWTDKDCYKNEPFRVTEEKWVACQTSRAKLGLLITIPIVLVVVILCIYFMPTQGKLIAGGMGLLVVGISVGGLVTAAARAEAEHETAMAPIISLMEQAKREGRTMDIEEARMLYAKNKAEIDKNYQQERAAQAQASGLTSAAGIVASALVGSQIFRKKEGGDDSGEEIETEVD